MARFQQGVLAAAALATTFGVCEQAHAGPPVEQGTLRLAAERMVGFSVNVPGRGNDAYFSTSLLASSNPGIMQFPRVGFDGFIIDGLSLGGALGLSYEGAGDTLFWHVMPRIGYAFALGRSFEFWPRGGIGVIGSSGPGWDNASGVFTGEGMFLWHFVPHGALIFGPAVDVVFDGGATAISGVAGLLVTW